MRRRVLILWAAVALGSVPALGHSPAENCNHLCDIIQTCAGRANHDSLGRGLCRIARCETGDQCISVVRSPSGRYLGAFQFSLRTWDYLCRPIFRKDHNPHCLVSGSIFDPCCSAFCAARIIAEGGIKHWPVCGEKREG